MPKHRYPIYVLSKGRYEKCPTAKFLIKDGVDFTLVVEKHERLEYAKNYGDHCRIVTLPPESSGRGAIPVRNWIWDDAIANGHERHWQLDDNINDMRRRYRGKRLICNSDIGFSIVEDFTDRYENIAIAGCNYYMFVPKGAKLPPFNLNVHVYSCMLIRNDIEQRWRGQYNADTDLCLQVLAAGWCTVLFNAIMVDKIATMIMKGGNTERYNGDGRLKMARSLERQWPGVVETKRRFGRPQHVIKDGWRRFDTPLKRRKDIDWDSLKPDEYGMKLKQVREIKRNKEDLTRFLEEANGEVKAHT